MSLTDTQIKELCKKMNIPLAGVFFKNEIPNALEKNKVYFINLDDDFDESGSLNSGSHWTCFVIVKYPNGDLAPMYFDSYGCPPPEGVKEKMMKSSKKKIPFSTKDIQSVMSNCCGWFCCAWAHYIFNFSHRTGDVYLDTEMFLDYFEDLNKSTNFMKNEYILKHFFQPTDPKLRKEITTIADTNSITQDNNGGIDAFELPATMLI